MLSKKISYQGKNVIVTGAASGLGRCLSIHFSKKGANLILIDKNGPLLKQVCFEINNLKGNVDSHVIDLSELEVLPDNIDTILMGYDRIDVLVNCAGIEVDGFVDDTPIEGFRENYFCLGSKQNLFYSYLRIPTPGKSYIYLNSFYFYFAK